MLSPLRIPVDWKAEDCEVRLWPPEARGVTQCSENGLAPAWGRELVVKGLSQGGIFCFTGRGQFLCPLHPQPVILTSGLMGRVTLPIMRMLSGKHSPPDSLPRPVAAWLKYSTAPHWD